MELFGFVFSVWAAVIFGVFFIAMVIGVSYDRRHTESPKWWIFLVGLIVYGVWQYNSLGTITWSTIAWGSFLTWVFLKPFVYYLAVGLIYSVVEFLLDLRRSKRYWATTWSEYVRKITNAAGDLGIGPNVAQDFVNKYGDNRYRIIDVALSSNRASVEPKVNRQQLAESIGCWTIFWPFYALSLILGDLVAEIFRMVADLVVSLSGRLVKVTFKDVFNF